MGARQSKRSVDITTTPKKGDGEVAAVSEEKIEQLGDADVKAIDVKAVVTNGTATHTDIEFADKDDETKDSNEKAPCDIKENGLPDTNDGEKIADKETVVPAAGDQPVKTEESTTEKAPENGNKAAETPDMKKQKEKKKKKWSLRSISFSKKDKSKPGKDKEKNGEVEEVNEEKTEEAVTEATAEVVSSDDKKTPVGDVQAQAANDDASKEEMASNESETVGEHIIKKDEELISAVETLKQPNKEPADVEECVNSPSEECVKLPSEDSAKPTNQQCVISTAEEQNPVVKETPSGLIAEEKIKEVVSSDPKIGDSCENSQPTEDAPIESVESTPAAPVSE